MLQSQSLKKICVPTHAENRVGNSTVNKGLDLPTEIKIAVTASCKDNLGFS